MRGEEENITRRGEKKKKKENDDYDREREDRIERYG